MAKANKDQGIAFELDSMDAKALAELMTSIDREIGRRALERRKDAVVRLRDLAEEYEMSIDQLFELARGRKSKSALPPRYRHPKERELTWTGRGRRPQWLLTYIGEGGALEDLRI